MPLFINREKRIELIGFDDRWMTIIGILIVTGIAYMLFSPSIIAEYGQKATLGCVAVSFGYTVFYWFTCRWIVINLRKNMPRPEQTSRRLFFTAIGVITLVLGSELIQKFAFPDVTTMRDTATSGMSAFLYDTVFTLVLCFMVIALYESIYFFVKYRQNAVEREQLARSQMQSQLSMLRQQVNPHFLFNNLNTLSSLIPEDQNKAGLFTQRLSSVYRRLTSMRHEETVSLSEEVQALEDYIFLLQSRFEDKLQVDIDIPDHHLSSQIPPLTLQLLLENVVKHNTVSSRHPMRVSVQASDEKISISNDRHARLRKQDSTGLGLENIRMRYELLTNKEIFIHATEATFEVVLPIIWKKQYEQQVSA